MWKPAHAGTKRVSPPAAVPPSSAPHHHDGERGESQIRGGISLDAQRHDLRECREGLPARRRRTHRARRTSRNGNRLCRRPAQQVPGTTLADTRTYKSDSLWNYELGTKTSWFDNHLTVNAAIFDIRWKNIQQNVLLSCGFQYIANAGAAESKGGELELHARPTEPLDLGSGSRIPEREDHRGGRSIAASRRIARVSGARLDGERLGDLYGAAARRLGFAEWPGLFLRGPQLQRQQSRHRPASSPAYRLLDARFALIKDKLEFALVGKNLTNEAANLGDSRSLAAEVPGRPRLFVNQPRTIGVEFREHF